MVGVSNRIAGVKCEVGTCFVTATHMEWTTVIPGDSSLRHERHRIDVALCRMHDAQFQDDGLNGVITAYGDEITVAR